MHLKTILVVLAAASTASAACTSTEVETCSKECTCHCTFTLAVASNNPGCPNPPNNHFNCPAGQPFTKTVGCGEPCDCESSCPGQAPAPICSVGQPACDQDISRCGQPTCAC
ncbi:hypothetical protein BDV27DRAFT_132945 [Aspergillus caelatus]|uniref:Uncharacterized protein n=1 Tax=Aspergillus caelatus TaxID=61420 RepID=A0A5N6ZXA4_9EURO|nr:uncharacterized protein BDV27DRAFT_132945 [Aspergillus caelatus]KAE8361566.1 hypothetical protein BDV27DRAFT_132945 [Aspergillus caelatus]